MKIEKENLMFIERNSRYNRYQKLNKQHRISRVGNCSTHKKRGQIFRPLFLFSKYLIPY